MDDIFKDRDGAGDIPFSKCLASKYPENIYPRGNPRICEGKRESNFLGYHHFNMKFKPKYSCRHIPIIGESTVLREGAQDAYLA